MLPLDDRFRERVADPTRPLASQQRDAYRYFPGTSPVPNQALPLTLNCRHSFTARLMLNRADDQGFLVGQGSELSGWALFVQDGHGVYVNNCVKLNVSEVRTSATLPVGREFSLGYEYEPVDIGFANVRLLVDGQVVAIGERVPAAPGVQQRYRGSAGGAMLEHADRPCALPGFLCVHRQVAGGGIAQRSRIAAAPHELRRSG